MKIFKSFSVLLCFYLGCLIFINVQAQSLTVELHAESWDISRHGEVLTDIPELNTLAKSWLKHQHLKIELRYPGGEEGELWVGELRDWLISLGIPSSAILITPGSDAADIINIVLIEAIK